jgi:WD40 repeat protein
MIEFNPDGRHLLATSRGDSASIWEPDIAEHPDHGRISWKHGFLPGEGATFSPDSRLVFTVFHDRGRIWKTDAAAGQAVLEGAERHSFRSIQFSEDGSRMLAIVDDPRRSPTEKPIRVWSTADGRQLAAFDRKEDRPRSAALSRDGKRVVAAGEIALLWDVESGTELHRFEGPGDDPPGRPGALNEAKAPPLDGIRENPINWAGFSPDGKLILTFPYPNYIDTSKPRAAAGHLWNATTGKLLRPLSYAKPQIMGFCKEAVFSRDGKRILASATDANAAHRLFDTATGRELAETEVHSSATPAVYSPAEDLIARGVGQQVVLWEAETGKVRQRLTGHEAPVTGVVFHPDGKLVLSTGEDKSVRLWDLSTGEPLAKFMHEGGREAAFSPDGRWIVTRAAQASRLWPVDPLAAALARKPRDLAPHERERYQIPND